MRHLITTFKMLVAVLIIVLTCSGRLILRTWGGVSCFDSTTYDDLIIAFFPCIYFCATSQIAFTYGCYNYRRLDVRGKTEAILSRSLIRERYYSLLLKLICVCSERGLRLIVENPWGEQTYLKNNFVLPPSYVDTDRTRRGDYFVKPTAYWFINCVPEHGFTPQRDKPRKRILETRRGKRAGVCSEERSAISPDYARNFICDNILGVGQSVGGVQMTLF